MSRQNRSGVYRLVDYFEEIVSGTALVVLVAAVVWGVLTRYITRTPATWTGDIASVSFAWLVFVGSAAAFKYGMHMSIDLLWNRIPEGPRRYLGLLVDAFLLVFLAYATWLGLKFCLATVDDPLPILRWPRSILYAAVTTGFACMFLRYAGIALRRFNGEALATHNLSAAEEGAEEWV